MGPVQPHGPHAPCARAWPCSGPDILRDRRPKVPIPNTVCAKRRSTVCAKRRRWFCGREANRIAVVPFRFVVLLFFFSFLIEVVSNVTSVSVVEDVSCLWMLYYYYLLI